MNVKNKSYKTIDVEKLFKAVKDSTISASKIATMVLNRDESYLTTVKTRGTMMEEDLIILCKFLSLNMDDIVIKEPEPVVVAETKQELTTPREVVNLDALILGINNLYQLEKANSVSMESLVEQLKVTNTKLGRLENLIGQIHTNEIQIKDNSKNLVDLQKETKSTVAIISGRLKDMLSKFK